MGTAKRVPLTRAARKGELSADAAWVALRRYGLWPLARDGWVRLRYGDGFSHARALAFQICLATIPALISLFGLSATIHQVRLGGALAKALTDLTPASSRDMVLQALGRSQHSAGTGGVLALVIGLITALVALTVAMAQIERGANRIYGVERDRPFAHKYGRGLLLAFTAGTAMVLGFVLVVGGNAIGGALADTYHWTTGVRTTWAVLRFPVGLALALLSASVLFHRAPRRPQPTLGWLASGAGVALALWLLITWLLGLYVDHSDTFGGVYGPLAAVMALLLWANLTSVALFYGLALAAQLESHRAGSPTPITPDPGPEGNPHTNPTPKKPNTKALA